jgi:hypothetical protein
MERVNRGRKVLRPQTKNLVKAGVLRAETGAKKPGLESGTLQVVLFLCEFSLQSLLGRNSIHCNGSWLATTLPRTTETSRFTVSSAEPAWMLCRWTLSQSKPRSRERSDSRRDGENRSWYLHLSFFPLLFLFFSVCCSFFAYNFLFSVPEYLAPAKPQEHKQQGNDS